MGLQLNKAILQRKKLFDLNIKVIDSDNQTSVYDKRDDFGFPVVNFTWLSCDVPRLQYNSIKILQLVRFAGRFTSVFDYHYEKTSNHFKSIDT